MLTVGRNSQARGGVPASGEHAAKVPCVCGLLGGVFVRLARITEPDDAWGRGDEPGYCGALVTREVAVDVGGDLRVRLFVKRAASVGLESGQSAGGEG
jgi:hypothetical protein